MGIFKRMIKPKGANTIEELQRQLSKAQGELTALEQAAGGIALSSLDAADGDTWKKHSTRVEAARDTVARLNAALHEASRQDAERVAQVQRQQKASRDRAVRHHLLRLKKAGTAFEDGARAIAEAWHEIFTTLRAVHAALPSTYPEMRAAAALPLIKRHCHRELARVGADRNDAYSLPGTSWQRSDGGGGIGFLAESEPALSEKIGDIIGWFDKLAAVSPCPRDISASVTESMEAPQSSPQAVEWAEAYEIAAADPASLRKEQAVPSQRSDAPSIGSPSPPHSDAAAQAEFDAERELLRKPKRASGRQKTQATAQE